MCIAAPLLYQFVLPEHAKKRIDIFLNPESDPRGAGYNIIQSKLAIGAGGLTGMGEKFIVELIQWWRWRKREFI